MGLSFLVVKYLRPTLFKAGKGFSILDIEKLANEHLLPIKPYIPGKPVEEVQRELGIDDVVKMASNENIFGPSPKVVEAICKAASAVNFYPDGGSYYLRTAIAEKFGVKFENVMVGSGVDELLRILCVSVLGPGDEIIFADPSFVMYGISAMVANAGMVKVPLRDGYYHDIPAMIDSITDRTKMIFVCNPNNPTGTIVKKDEIDLLMEKVPENVLVVMDEAYYEYVQDPDYPQTMEYFKQGKNIVVFRTFSKAYGLAGLRVGYGFVEEKLGEVFHRVRNPFNVNLLAQTAALVALEEQENVRRVVDSTVAGKEQIYAGLDAMGIRYVPTEANFILIDCETESVPVFEALLRKGVIVRPGQFLGFPTCIRVSICLEKENERFLVALKEVLGK